MGMVEFAKRIFSSEKKDYSTDGVGMFSNLASKFNQGPSPRINPGNMGSYLGKYADQSWVYSCIKVIQTKAAGVPLLVYKKVGEELEEQINHPLSELLESVNPFMNGFDLKEATHGFLELTGNAYWLLDAMLDGRPTEIYSINPQCIRILANKTRNITGYAYEIEPGKVERVFMPEEILHFKSWNPLDDFYGLAPICAARDSSDMIMFSDQYNKAFFQNGAEPGGFLTTDSSLNEDSVKQIRATWKKIHQGYRRSHNIAVLDGGMKFSPSASTHQEMAFGELKRMSREDVLTVYNIPPIMVGVFDEANYSNAKEQRRIFWIDCIIPRLRKMESVINEGLVKAYQEDLIVKYDLTGIEDIAEDAAARARSDSINVSSGILTINEVRDTLGYDPVPWGETWYAPFGVAPVTLPGDQPPEPIQPPVETPPTPPPAKALTIIKEDQPLLPAPPANDPIIRRDHIWVKYKSLTERLEKRWVPQMRKLFNDQEREVIGNLLASAWQKTLNQNRLDHMKNIKASIDVILFDRNQARSVFRKTATALMRMTVSESAAKEINEYGLGIDFNLVDHNVTNWINNKAFKFADEVNMTTEEALRETLKEAISAGDSLSMVEDRIAEVFDIARGSRTAMISRTEVISASNEGAMESYIQSGVVDSTEWITSRDNRVRDEHLIDGETVKIKEPFSNGLLYPGDPAGEPGNIINCRCTTAPIVNKD